jgi:hypothetical protein
MKYESNLESQAVGRGEQHCKGEPEKVEQHKEENPTT